MAEIPLVLKLKKQMHKDIARYQDIIVKELYSVFNNAVLHGGTAIWRCYKGNRFSEDIDVYVPKDEKHINILFKNLEKSGFNVMKKKISENSIFSKLESNRIIVRFEALFRKSAPSILKEYEKSDGNLVTVYTLTPEEFIKEKVETYIKRRKIRDMYDIFFLLRFVEDKKKVTSYLDNFFRNYKEPLDEKDLKTIIIEGLIPSTQKMMEYIRSA